MWRSAGSRPKCTLTPPERLTRPTYPARRLTELFSECKNAALAGTAGQYAPVRRLLSVSVLGEPKMIAQTIGRRGALGLILIPAIAAQTSARAGSEPIFIGISGAYTGTALSASTSRVPT